jgi:hypothetical protein
VTGGMRARGAVAFVLAVSVACAAEADPGADGAAAGDAQLAADTVDARGELRDDRTLDGEWVVLFDGTDLSAWRGYRSADVPAAWQLRDGILAFVPGEDGGDLVTRDRFGDFELELSWSVEPGGNSGIFYRATEEPDYIWQAAPEMQILDDDRHADGRSPLTSAGSLFALYPVVEDVVKPAGEWNDVRIVARGPRVQHWLNGVKVVEYEVGSADWTARVQDSKFAELEGFAVSPEGHIGLQDHGDPVRFRDIRVRPIAGGADPDAGG